MKLLLSAATIIASVAYNASAITSQPADTVKVLHNVTSLTITESSGNKTQIHVTGQNGSTTYDYDLNTETADNILGEPLIDIDIPFVNILNSSSGHKSRAKKRSKFSTIFGHDLYVGALIESNSDVIDGGWEIGFNYLVGGDWQPRGGGLHLRTGLGIAYRRFGTRPGYIISMPSQAVEINRAPDNAVKASGHLRSFNLRVPFSISQTIGKSFFIEIAAILNFNFNTKGSTKYIIDNHRQKDSFSGLHQRLLTPEAHVSIGFRKSIAIYYSSPFTTMRRDYGPQFRHSAVGVSLNF